MNWNALITELEGVGLTQKEIAEHVGCSQPYVSQLKSGARKSPEFDIGNAMVKLHRDRVEARAA
jgi:predicted transcriptional regulator